MTVPSSLRNSVCWPMSLIQHSDREPVEVIPLFYPETPGKASNNGMTERINPTLRHAWESL
jgi:hypothetical protein